MPCIWQLARRDTKTVFAADGLAPGPTYPSRVVRRDPSSPGFYKALAEDR